MLGDSKTGDGIDTYQTALVAQLESAPEMGVEWSKVDTRFRDAHGGFTVAQLKATVDSWLASQNVESHFFLVNMGINDRTSLPSQASFEADYLYILDAIHVKWPRAKVLVQQVWAKGYDAVSDTLDGWIANVVMARPSFAELAGDERVYLKGSDDGLSETDQPLGLHPINPGGTTGKGYPDMAAAFVTAILGHY